MSEGGDIILSSRTMTLSIRNLGFNEIRWRFEL